MTPGVSERCPPRAASREPRAASRVPAKAARVHSGFGFWNRYQKSACEEYRARYAPCVTGQVRRNRRFLAAGLCVFGFVACHTYDPSLIGSADPSLPAEEAGASGTSSAAGTGAGGADLVAGAVG